MAVVVEIVAVLSVLVLPASGRSLSMGSHQQPSLNTNANKEVYTDNAICLRRYCINPLFPGLRLHQENALRLNENRSWECVQNVKEWKDTGFCGKVIAGYQFAVPALRPGDPYLSLQERIAKQRDFAVHAYVAHISGMGHDFWDYTQPWEHDECIQSVWKMVCYTSFPKCNHMQTGVYLRPCESSCNNYLRACRVECCDEGAKCLFDHKIVNSAGVLVTDDGYTPHTAPSPLCTGAAAPWHFTLGSRLVLLGALVTLGLGGLSTPTA